MNIFLGLLFFYLFIKILIHLLNFYGVPPSVYGIFLGFVVFIVISAVVLK
jgi:hypothetical protein